MLRLIGILIAAYVVGFVAFVATLPKVDPQAVHADGIVALTGGDARLDTAVALLEHGAAKRLLVTGVNSITTKAELKALSHGGKRFDCCADLGYAAEDTHGNALEAAGWAVHRHYASLIVVTARYHMPRSLTEFHAAMPHVRLVAYPVEPSGDGSPWWMSPAQLHLLHYEYAKYLASVVMTAWESPAADTTLDRSAAARKSRLAS